MTKQIQFIQTSPDELKEQILKDLREELKQLSQNFQPKEPSEYLTRQEVAELLKVDLTTVWNWSRNGKLKRVGIGNRIYYLRSEVENAIKPID